MELEPVWPDMCAIVKDWLRSSCRKTRSNVISILSNAGCGASNNGIADGWQCFAEPGLGLWHADIIALYSRLLALQTVKRANNMLCAGL